MTNSNTITRTFRAAIRLGEDFITLEESITLPTDATDDQIGQAVDFGWRIYGAQRESLDKQVAELRATMPTSTSAAPPVVRDPGQPATDKQRNFIAKFQDDLWWSSEQMAEFAREQGVDLVMMTKGQASALIEALIKHQASPAPARPVPSRQNAAPVAPLPSEPGADDDIPF